MLLPLALPMRRPPPYQTRKGNVRATSSNRVVDEGFVMVQKAGTHIALHERETHLDRSVKLHPTRLMEEGSEGTEGEHSQLFPW